MPSTKGNETTQLNDQIVSTNDFEVFWHMYFDIAPSDKPSDTCRSVLQELKRAPKKTYESAKIVQNSLTIERAQDGYVAPPYVFISDAESIPKFLTKLSKFFPQCKPRKEKPFTKVRFAFSTSLDDILDDLREELSHTNFYI